MSVTPFNIIQGPATLYTAPWTSGGQPSIAAYVQHNPDSVSVTTPFVDVGGTTGGVTVEVDETLTDIHVDQLLDPVGARITARTIQVTTTMMETEISNLVTALNGTSTGATVTTDGSTYSELDLITTTSATQPTYCTVIIDGWAPTLTSGAPAKRRFIIQKALSQPKISQKFDMANQATVGLTFTAYYVSSSTAPGTGPFTIIDGLA